jgi:hypothetical protein
MSTRRVEVASGSNWPSLDISAHLGASGRVLFISFNLVSRCFISPPLPDRLSVAGETKGQALVLFELCRLSYYSEICCIMRNIRRIGV